MYQNTVPNKIHSEHCTIYYLIRTLYLQIQDKNIVSNKTRLMNSSYYEFVISVMIILLVLIPKQRCTKLIGNMGTNII